MKNTATTSESAEKKRKGPAPYTPPADRPHYLQEWEELRAWWKDNSALYNVREIGKRLGIDHTIVSRLLSGSPGPRQTVEHLDALSNLLGQHFKKAEK